jgi:hypothetical protein
MMVLARPRQRWRGFSFGAAYTPDDRAHELHNSLGQPSWALSYLSWASFLPSWVSSCPGHV